MIATNYVAPNHDGQFYEMMRLVQNQIGSSVFTFAQWKNLLMSDRELSDEYRYVFDRENEERKLGNNLDRPSLMNKR